MCECFAKVARQTFGWRIMEVQQRSAQVVGAIRHLWFYLTPGIQFANKTCDQCDSSGWPKAFNRTHVVTFEAGRLTHVLRSRLVIKTANKYYDKSGRKRCVGTKALKGTQWAPEHCQLSIVV